MDGGLYFARTVFLTAWFLAEAKARAVRTPDLASILTERVSALETAGEDGRGLCEWVVVEVSGVLACWCWLRLFSDLVLVFGLTRVQSARCLVLSQLFCLKSALVVGVLDIKCTLRPYL